MCPRVDHTNSVNVLRQRVSIYLKFLKQCLQYFVSKVWCDAAWCVIELWINCGVLFISCVLCKVRQGAISAYCMILFNYVLLLYSAFYPFFSSLCRIILCLAITWDYIKSLCTRTRRRALGLCHSPCYKGGSYFSYSSIIDASLLTSHTFISFDFLKKSEVNIRADVLRPIFI